MTNRKSRKAFPLIERINPQAAALLREADQLRVAEIDFTDIFAADVSGDEDFFSYADQGSGAVRDA